MTCGRDPRSIDDGKVTALKGCITGRPREAITAAVDTALSTLYAVILLIRDTVWRVRQSNSKTGSFDTDSIMPPTPLLNTTSRTRV
jgi:hypothetical protein